MSKDYSIVFKNIQDTKAKVKNLLINFPSCKESDDKLLALFWFYELEAKDLEGKVQTKKDFLSYLSKGNLTSAESIRRSRQDLFKNYPELRGDNYIDRKKAGFETKEQFKNQQ